MMMNREDVETAMRKYLQKQDEEKKMRVRATSLSEFIDKVNIIKGAMKGYSVRRPIPNA